VRRIGRSPSPGSGECIFTSVLNDTIHRVLTRIPSGDANENRLLAGISANNCSQALGDALRLLSARVDHEQPDFSFAEQACQI
jgi:hypothetical protein